ncbi:MAG: hypothetical protein OXE53_00660 [Deltaproteobacteria bacterium]|nr:hypothetical protein [Deltaproteobacteria bacterium]
MALFILGFVAGRLFSSPSGGVGVLVVALLVGAGAGASMDPKSPAGIAQDDGLTVAPARVGTMSAIRWRTAVPGGR